MQDRRPRYAIDNEENEQGVVCEESVTYLEVDTEEGAPAWVQQRRFGVLESAARLVPHL